MHCSESFTESLESDKSIGGVVVKRVDSKHRDVGIYPSHATIKMPSARKATENHHIKFIFLEKTQSPGKNSVPCL